MEGLTATDIILGLLSFIMLLLSAGVKMLWTRGTTNAQNIADNREKCIAKQDDSTEKVRTEINNLATSLRKDMAAQTELLLKIAQKN